MILDFNKKKKEVEYKKAVIFNTLVRYYKDLNNSKAVNIPYFLAARNTFNEIIKNNKYVNYYLNKIVERV